MRSEIPKTSLQGDDELEKMAGGWAPSADTPTHFFGRDETKAIRTSTPKKKVEAEKKPAPKRIEHWKVAPGVTLAYEMPASPTKSPGDRGLAQTEKPVDESGSSILDHDRPLMHGAADDGAPEHMTPDEESMAKGDVPAGEDLMSEKKPEPVQPGFEIELGESAQERGRTALPPTPQVGLAAKMAQATDEGAEELADELVGQGVLVEQVLPSSDGQTYHVAVSDTGDLDAAKRYLPQMGYVVEGEDDYMGTPFLIVRKAKRASGMQLFEG